MITFDNIDSYAGVSKMAENYYLVALPAYPVFDRDFPVTIGLNWNIMSLTLHLGPAGYPITFLHLPDTHLEQRFNLLGETERREALRVVMAVTYQEETSVQHGLMRRLVTGSNFHIENTVVTKELLVRGERELARGRIGRDVEPVSNYIDSIKLRESDLTKKVSRDHILFETGKQNSGRTIAFTNISNRNIASLIIETRKLKN